MGNDRSQHSTGCQPFQLLILGFFLCGNLHKHISVSTDTDTRCRFPPAVAILIPFLVLGDLRRLPLPDCTLSELLTRDSTSDPQVDMRGMFQNQEAREALISAHKSRLFLSDC